MFLIVFVKKSFMYVWNIKKYHVVIVTCLVTILSVMVHGLFDTIYFRPQLQFVFWTMVAFVSAVLYSEECKCYDK